MDEENKISNQKRNGLVTTVSILNYRGMSILPLAVLRVLVQSRVRGPIATLALRTYSPYRGFYSFCVPVV